MNNNAAPMTAIPNEMAAAQSQSVPCRERTHDATNMATTTGSARAVSRSGGKCLRELSLFSKRMLIASNDRTHRRGRPKTLELETDVARPRSVQ